MGAAFMVLPVAFLVTNCITYCLCRTKMLGLGRLRIYDFLYIHSAGFSLTSYLCCGSIETIVDIGVFELSSEILSDYL